MMIDLVIVTIFACKMEFKF